jgi:hypothetical protein
MVFKESSARNGHFGHIPQLPAEGQVLFEGPAFQSLDFIEKL